MDEKWVLGLHHGNMQDDDPHEWTWYWSSWRGEGVNSGICQCLELWEEGVIKGQSRGSVHPEEVTRRGLNSLDLRMLFLRISSRMILFQKVMVKSRQLLHPSWPCSLGPRRQRSRNSKESRMIVMFLKHWVSTTECLLRMVLWLFTSRHWRYDLLHTSSLLVGRWVWWRVEKKSVTYQFTVQYKSEKFWCTIKKIREDYGVHK